MTHLPKNKKIILFDGMCNLCNNSVLKVIRFDTKNNFHMLEDIDFSTRVASFYGNRLYINLNAKLEHNFSEMNREYHGPRQYRKIREFVSKSISFELLIKNPYCHFIIPEIHK